jgi:hypothetical protein
MSKKPRRDPYKNFNFRVLFAGIAAGIAALLIVKMFFPPDGAD